MAVFSEAFLRLRQDLDQSHESRQKLIEDIRANVREMARQTGNQLAEQGRQPPRGIRGDDHATCAARSSSRPSRRADNWPTWPPTCARAARSSASRQPAREARALETDSDTGARIHHARLTSRKQRRHVVPPNRRVAPDRRYGPNPASTSC